MLGVGLLYPALLGALLLVVDEHLLYPSFQALCQGMCSWITLLTVRPFFAISNLEGYSPTFSFLSHNYFVVQKSVPLSFDPPDPAQSIG